MSVKLMEFGAEWCGPCRQQEPILEDLEEHYEDDDGVEIVQIDCDEEQALASEYGVRSIPAMFVEVDGEKVSSFVGVTSFDDLEHAIESNR